MSGRLSGGPRGYLSALGAILAALVVAVIVVALGMGDVNGEVLIGAGGLMLALVALLVAGHELAEASERGRLERLWTLEARWHGTEGVEARIDASVVLEQLRSTPPEARLKAFQDLRSLDDRQRLRRARVILTLNLLEDLGEAAEKGYVDAGRVYSIYGPVFRRLRTNWSFYIDQGQLGAGADDDAAFVFLDRVARRCGYPANDAGGGVDGFDGSQ